MARKKHRYGCRPDIKDHRDHKFCLSSHYTPVKLPPSADLSSQLPDCWDQGELGSCTGHGSGAAWAFIHKGLMPSRLMIYYNAREIEGDTDQDNGAQIRDVVSGLANKGVCLEDLWPYDITKFSQKPPDDDYTSAVQYKIAEYLRIEDLGSLKNSLASGFPVIIGFTVYSNMEGDDVAQTGMVHFPGKNDYQIGGHCVLAVGYDDTKAMVLCRNSWGTSWALKGYFWLDYQYFTQGLVSDMWTIRA